MSDLVERLRAEAESCRDVCNSLETASCMWIAADEIERLRAILIECVAELEGMGVSEDMTFIQEARRALGEAKDE